MSRWLVLHFDAPLMSFGRGVDQQGHTDDHPSLSMVTGLLGNALGWGHADTDKLDALQDRLLLASREEVPGRDLLDFQTVDLSQSFLTNTGWTTRGRPEAREGGNSDGTHIRYRRFLASAVFTVVIGLRPGEGPSLDDLHAAVTLPARPLFLGRKPCIPSRPLVPAGDDAWVEASELRDAVRAARRPAGLPAPAGGRRIWYASEQDTGDAHTLLRRDIRRWRADTHEGTRFEATEVHHG